MKTKLLISTLILLLILLFSNSQFVQSQGRECMRIGVGQDGLSDYSLGAPFIDVFKATRQFIWLTPTTEIDVRGDYDDYMSTLKPDTSGYPTIAWDRYNGPNKGCYIYCYVAAYLKGNTRNRLMAGTYYILFDGIGTIDFYGRSTVVPGNPNKYKVVLESSTLGNITMRINSSAGFPNHVRNIRILPEKYVDVDTKANPFMPEYLQYLDTFNVVRFMDFANTNNSSLVKWEDRARVGYYSYNISNVTKNRKGTYSDAGVPYEMMIKLCNQLKINPWVCVPAMADSNFIYQMARLWYYNLDPDLDVYLEYSNETWNGQFDQFHYLLNEYAGQGFPNPLWDGTDKNARNSAYHEAQIFRIWRRVFAEDSLRVIRVMAIQTAWPENTMYEKKAVLGNNWDAVAGTWYIGDPGGAGTLKERLINHCNDRIASDWSIIFSTAKQYGKEVITYEGGQHLVGDEYCAIQTSKDIYDVYDYYLDTLRSLGLRLANAFVFCAPICANGWSWGHLDDYFRDPATVSIATVPKYKALLDNIVPSCNAVSEIPLTDERGAGNSLLMDGRDDYVSINNVLMPDERQDYTAEMWIKPIKLNFNQSILSWSNKASAVGSSYSKLGLDSTNRIIWNITNDAGAKIVNIKSSFSVEGYKWYHLAIVRSGGVYILYVNGVIEGSVSANLLGTYTRNSLTLGGIITSQGCKENFKGEVDELRVWKVAISDIRAVRDFMCRRLNPLPVHPYRSGLELYYRFDVVDTKKVFDKYETKNGDINNISFVKGKSTYTRSGAPIGDNSMNIYTSDWTGVGLTYSHANGDKFSIKNMGSGIPNGAHVYCVDEQPGDIASPPNYEGMGLSKYYGVFMANGTEPSYDIVYKYSGHPAATDANKVRLVKRNDNADVPGNDVYSGWRHAGGDKDYIVSTISLNCREKTRGEYILGLRRTYQSNVNGSGYALKGDMTTTNAGVVNPIMLNPDFTLMAWVKGSGYFATFENNGSPKPLYIKVGDPKNELSKLNVTIKADDSWNRDTINKFSITSTGVNGTPNEWNHYAIVKSGNTFKAYINGILVLQDTREKPWIQRTILKLGGVGWPEEDPKYVERFNGLIDEVSVWTTALDQQMIRDWMCKKISKQHPYQCANLQVYFNFDEGPGVNVLEDKLGASDMILNKLLLVKSGAPVGILSANDYVSTVRPTSATGKAYNLSLTNPYQKDVATFTMPQAQNGLGAHLYLVKGRPANNTYSTGILSADTSHYWGVFTFGGAFTGESTAKTYNLKVDYTNNANVKKEAEIRLIHRKDDASTAWGFDAANHVLDNTLNTTIQNNNAITSDHEFMMGGTTTSTYLISIQPPKTPGPITVNPTGTSFCQGVPFELSVPYDGEIYPDGYEWEIPSGLIGSSTDRLINLRGQTPASKYTVRVRAVNNAGVWSSWASIDIAITASPASPEIILGDATVCGNSQGKIYNIQPITGASSYIWTLTGNGTIASGNGTREIAVNFGAGPATSVLSVYAEAPGCNSGAQTKNITVLSASAPPAPGAITGTSNCPTGLLTYSVPNDGVTYTWQLPQPGKIISGNGTSTINTDMTGVTTGTITVSSSGGSCQASGSSTDLEIVCNNAQARFTLNKTSACLNEQLTVTDASSMATSWSWNFGSGALPATANTVGPHNISYSSEGTKTITLTVNGSLVYSETVVVGSSSILRVDKTDVTTCGGSNGIITIVPVGTDVYEYSLGNNEWFQSPTFTRAAGTYQAVIRKLDGSCASNPTTVIISATVPPSFVSVVTTPITTCGVNNGSIDITATGSVDKTIEYSIDGGANYQASKLFSDLNASAYSLSIRYTDLSCKKDSSSSIIITDPARPIIDKVETTPVSNCGLSDGSITIFSSTIGVQYSSDNGTTWQGNTFSNLLGGTYNIIAKAGSCEVALDAIEVIAPSPITINLVTPVDVSNCLTNNDGSISIDATGSDEIWYSLNGGTKQTSNQFSGLSAGLYIVGLSYANSACSILSPNVTLKQAANPVINSITKTDITDCVDGRGSLIVNVSATDYEFSLDDVSWGLSNSFFSLPAKTYTIHVRMSGATSCTHDTTVTITQPASPIMTFITTDVTSCNATDGSIEITSTYTEPVSYWLNDVLQTGNVFTDLAPGDYSIKVALVNFPACSTINAAKISAPGTPKIISVSSTNITKCGAKDGSITISAAGAIPITYYLNSTTSNETGYFTAVEKGSYDPYVVANGCIVPCTQIIITEMPIDPDFAKFSGNDGFCSLGSSSTFLNTHKIIGNTYEWDYTGGTINTTSDDSVTITWTHDVGQIILKETNPATGCYNRMILDISIDTIAPTFSACPSTIVLEAEIKDASLLFNVTDTLYDLQAMDNCSVSSIFNNYNASSSLQGAIITKDTKISWIVTDHAGNTNTCEVDYLLNANFDLMPFSAFSPNNDNVNDVWVIKNIELKPNVIVKVFNRWGEIVFESVGYRNNWNGCDMNGVKLEVDSYHYVLIEGKTNIKRGIVSILK